jgi:hypothetical protein
MNREQQIIQKAKDVIKLLDTQYTKDGNILSLEEIIVVDGESAQVSIGVRTLLNAIYAWQYAIVVIEALAPTADEAMKALDYIVNDEFMGGKLYYKNGEHYHPANETIANHPSITIIRSYITEAQAFRKRVEEKRDEIIKNNIQHGIPIPSALEILTDLLGGKMK